MKKTLLYTAMTALMIGSTTAAIADSHGGEHHDRGAKKFEKIDTNKDGVISKSEHLSHAEERFTKMDANGDGNVSIDEAKAHKEAKKAKRKARKDK